MACVAETGTVAVFAGMGCTRSPVAHHRIGGALIVKELVIASERKEPNSQHTFVGEGVSSRMSS